MKKWAIFDRLEFFTSRSKFRKLFIDHIFTWPMLQQKFEIFVNIQVVCFCHLNHCVDYCTGIRSYDQSEYVTTVSPERILELYKKYCIRPIEGVVVSIMVPPALSGIYFLKNIVQKCPENICANCPTLNLLSILPNGDVGLCAEAYRSSLLGFGNINDKTLDEIWEREFTKSLLRGFL